MITGTFGVLVVLKSTITFTGCALLAEGGMRHYIVQHTARLPDYHYLNDNKLSKQQIYAKEDAIMNASNTLKKLGIEQTFNSGYPPWQRGCGC